MLVKQYGILDFCVMDLVFQERLNYDDQLMRWSEYMVHLALSLINVW